jgi:hypothetical protein
MASLLARFESYRFLPLGTLKALPMQLLLTTKGTVGACQTIRNYPQPPRHFWTDTAAHVQTCRRVHRISWRTLRALITNVLFQLYLTNWMFPDTWWYGHFFLVWYVELVPKICPRLSVTLSVFNCGCFSYCQLYLLPPQYGAPSGCRRKKQILDVESKCEYVEKTVTSSQQGVVLQLRSMMGTSPHPKWLAYNEMLKNVSELDWFCSEK